MNKRMIKEYREVLKNMDEEKIIQENLEKLSDENKIISEEKSQKVKKIH